MGVKVDEGLRLPGLTQLTDEVSIVGGIGQESGKLEPGIELPYLPQSPGVMTLSYWEAWRRPI
jgi:hypothetical protein